MISVSTTSGQDEVRNLLDIDSELLHSENSHKNQVILLIRAFCAFLWLNFLNMLEPLFPRVVNSNPVVLLLGNRRSDSHLNQVLNCG